MTNELHLNIGYPERSQYLTYSDNIKFFWLDAPDILEIMLGRDKITINWSDPIGEFQNFLQSINTNDRIYLTIYSYVPHLPEIFKQVLFAYDFICVDLRNLLMIHQMDLLCFIHQHMRELSKVKVKIIGDQPDFLVCRKNETFQIQFYPYYERMRYHKAKSQLIPSCVDQRQKDLLQKMKAIPIFKTKTFEETPQESSMRKSIQTDPLKIDINLNLNDSLSVEHLDLILRAQTLRKFILQIDTEIRTHPQSDYENCLIPILPPSQVLDIEAFPTTEEDSFLQIYRTISQDQAKNLKKMALRIDKHYENFHKQLGLITLSHLNLKELSISYDFPSHPQKCPQKNKLLLSPGLEKLHLKVHIGLLENIDFHLLNLKVLSISIRMQNRYQFKILDKIENMSSLRTLRLYLQRIGDKSKIIKKIFSIKQITSLTLQFLEISNMNYSQFLLLCKPSPQLEYYDLTLQNLKFNLEGQTIFPLIVQMYTNQQPRNYTRVRLLNIQLTDEELKIAGQINLAGYTFRIEYYNFSGVVGQSSEQFEKSNLLQEKQKWLSKVEKFMESNSYRSRSLSKNPILLEYVLKKLLNVF